MARIALVQNLYEDQLGLLWVSACLRERGHRSMVFIADSRRGLLRRLHEFNPHIVGFPCTTGNTSFVLETARDIRKVARPLIVVGGPHPTHMPGIIDEDPVDIVCIGEGEHAMADLADAVDRSTDFTQIRNLWVKHDGRISRNELRPLIPDLDSLPFPDRSYYERYRLLRNKTAKMFICSRGCPFNCTFCSNPSLKKLYRSKGKFVRFRSPVNVVTEIRQVMSSSRLSFCQFVDELMISDKEWLRDFLAQYRKMIRLPFSCPVHARILDETTVKDLRDAGCDCVSFGVETGNEVLRRTVLGKDVSNSDIIAAAGLLKKHGIRCKTFNMFGLPNETVENALETLRLNRMIRPDYLFASIVQFLPGTELTEYAMREGIIDKDFAVKSTASYFKSSIARMRDINKIIRLQKLFAALVHLPIPERAVRILLSLHLDVLYEAVFVVTYGIMVVRSARKRFLNTLLIGVKLMRFFRS
ncbi:MAG: B12-binding domain-containing radical SAM protein [Candidatus Aureabacteria bacterium]|nr:B12-binding domain-containing radical SAM protein [Candidatus Auribacterota bacterium]